MYGLLQERMAAEGQRDSRFCCSSDAKVPYFGVVHSEPHHSLPPSLPTSLPYPLSPEPSRLSGDRLSQV